MKAVSFILLLAIMLAVNLPISETRSAKEVEVESEEAKTVQANKKQEENVEDEEGEILLKGHLFQDIFMEHLAPEKIQFGHVFENPSDWEQRFEKRDFAGNRHQGKVKWGNQNGGYGEHYWDLNH